MVWNHRVFKETQPGGTPWYTIREVYYPKIGGKPDSWTADAIAAGGETVEELRDELQRMLRATEQPVIEDTPIP